MRATRRTLTRTVAGEEIATFVPYPLPPRDPELNVVGALAAPLRRAEQALARLEVAGEIESRDLGCAIARMTALKSHDLGLQRCPGFREL
jgi:hypothetical protein